MSKSEIKEWVSDALANPPSDEVPIPQHIIRALMAQSVLDNWPRYETAYDEQGNVVILRFGSASAANKALEMLAKDAGMLGERLDVSGTIDIRINGVDVEDLR
jgi:hypothetical protein